MASSAISSNSLGLLVPTPMSDSSQHSSAPRTDDPWAPLVLRVGRGDRDAFAGLYDAASSQVFGLILRIVRDRPAAEELLVDVFSQAWRQAAQYDAGRGTAVSWLLLIARSRSIDYVRSKAHRVRASEDSVDDSPREVRDPSPTPEREAVLGQQRQRIRAALAGLDEAKREAIELAFFSGLTHTEIAERLSEPIGTVKTRIRSGMLQLRRSLAAYGGAQ